MTRRQSPEQVLAGFAPFAEAGFTLKKTPTALIDCLERGSPLFPAEGHQS